MALSNVIPWQSSVKVRDSQIQLTPFLADDLQCIADSSGDEEDGIGAEKRLSCHRLDVGVACVEKRSPCLHG